MSLLLALAFSVFGLSVQSSLTIISHADLVGEELDASQQQEAIDRLRTWAQSHHFTELHSENDIEKAIDWAGKPIHYSPVFIRQLSPTDQASQIYITVLNINELFRVTLTSKISGNDAEREKQQNLMQKERMSFLEAFKDVSFLTLKPKQTTAANP
ncbi:MAG TPA: hypothetical protein VIM61_04450 [Chthoniobacterales bacterium]|jgi:hypothetical protein